jgi:1L-myo-inositol 1-phosphate cytidylyltransferase / CDP-L-myo-inositol myo-inositolphosphotransferase
MKQLHPEGHMLSDTPNPPAAEPVTQALILAAGMGSRLQSGTPKPLQRVLGLPLLARTMFTLQRAGVTDVYVVVGYEAERVMKGMRRWERDGLTVHWIQNPDWREPNGVSVLAGEDELDGPFYLTMTDHLFQPAVLDALARVGARDGINLAVDYRVGEVLDLDDATKVRVAEGRIAQIGKALTEYDAIDTGVFLASPKLFQALRAARADGEMSLSAGVQRLAAEGHALVTDIGDLMWQDVDNQADLAEAKRKLLAGIRKDSDGAISRFLNRPLSTALSRVLVNTPVTPNQISVSTLVISLIAAGYAASGGYLHFLIAGVLFQIASIVDGTDGEVAKLKFQTSHRGEWIDTVCDNLSYLAFLIGLIVGVQRSELPSFYFLAGVVGFVAAAASIANLTSYVAREKDSGSFLSVRYGYQDGTGLGARFMRAVHFMGKRDFFAFLALVLAIMGQLPLALPIFGVGATLLLFPATLKANVTSWRRQRRGASGDLTSSQA